MSTAPRSLVDKPYLVPLDSSRQPLSYIPYLNGLRAVSILLVMVAHFGYGNLVPAGFGVTIFFFISGFLITRLLFSEQKKSLEKTISIKNFYIRRFFRILPALIVSVFGVVLAYWAMGIPIPTIEILASFLFFENYLINASHALGHHTVLPLNCLWSLAVEEHFYILWPLVFSLLSKNIRRFTLVIISVLILALAWRLVWIYALKGNPLYCYYATDTRVDSILYGALMSILCIDKSRGRKLLTACSHWLYPALLVLMATFLIKDDALRQTVRYSVQGVTLLVIFSGLFFSRNYTAIKSVLENDISRFIGKISYSLCLWHYPVYHILKMLLPDMERFALAVSATLISFVCAFFSYTVIETQFIRIRKKLPI